MKKSNRWIGIRGQFLLLLAGLVLFVTVTTALMASHSQRVSIVHERKLRGLAVLRSWSSLCRERLLSDESMNLAMWDFVDELMKTESAVEEVYLLDTLGVIMMHNDQTKLGTHISQIDLSGLRVLGASGIHEEAGPKGTRLIFYRAIIFSGKRLGYARVVFSSQGIEEGIQGSMRDMFLAAVLIGIIGILVLSYLVYHVTRPIKLLVDGVRRFGEVFDPQNPETANVRVEFSSHNEIGDLRDSFNEMTGALSKSLSERKALKEETGILRMQATTDGLTGLFNKRQFEEDFPKLVQLAAQKSRALCVLMMDMDHFKQLNDTMGHAAGDKALQDLAHSLNDRIRASDRAYRLGGDEFVLVSVGANLEQAQGLAQRVAEEYDRRKAPGNPTTISFGIVAFDGVSSHQALLKAADEEMYRVKREKKAQR